MNILLTGGSGFIGRNIRESYLSQKYNIIAPSHSELNLLEEDAVKDFFIKNKIEIVIHSAAKPAHRNAKDLTNILQANTRMFFNLARNVKYYKKMIVLGSGAVYDMRYDLRKVREDYFGSHVPLDDYGFTRYICASYMDIDLVDKVTEFRIFGIFGKYEDYAIRFISNAICKTVFDLPITIKQNRKFDYLFIEDLFPILDFFIQNKVMHKAYNITPDDSVELYTLAEEVKKISGKDLPIIVREMGMGLEYSGDNSRLREEMKQVKFTPLVVAIEELYRWYVENKHTINKEFLLVDK